MANATSVAPRLRECDLYRPLPKGWVQCTACHHWCAIPPEGVGKCGVRRNHEGKLYLVTYGKIAAMHVDPVEKKPLFHFHPGEPILSMGTVGCNLFCQFCQNWHISQFRDFKVDFKTGQTDRWIGEDWPPDRVVDTARKMGVRLLAYTYNEPVVWAEYAHDIAELAKAEGMKNVFVSSGFETKHAWNYMEPYLDAVNLDLKGFTEEFYRKITGARLKPVLENIEFLGTEKWGKIWMEVTTLLLHGYNDSEEEIRGMARFLASVNPEIPWHLTAAHPDYKMQDLEYTPRTVLLKAYDIAKEEGLKFVYLGNIRDPEHESTYCPDCGELLIYRDVYRIKPMWKEPGVCPRCGRKIPGVWTWEQKEAKDEA